MIPKLISSHTTGGVLIPYRLQVNRTVVRSEWYHVMLVDPQQRAYLYTGVLEKGSTDLCFEAPCFGDICQVWVAPMETWERHPNAFSSLHLTYGVGPSKHCHTFVATHEPCVYEPEGNPAPREEKILAGNHEYCKRKQDTLRFLWGMLAVGTATCAELKGLESAEAFLAGGMMGMVYQILLQYEVDRVGTHQFLVNTITRLAVVISLGSGFGMATDHPSGSTDVWMASLGFFLQKIALWIAFTM